MSSTPLSCTLIGSDTLLLQCAEIWRDAGHEVRGVVTAEPRIEAWCAQHGITVWAPGADLGARLAQQPAFDYLFAITHLELLPADVLTVPRRSAINFHDGPLPRYAGLNATSWALLQQEKTHGITWHTIVPGVDAGDILLAAPVAIDPDDTALTLNARCFETAIATFKELTGLLATGRAAPQPQDLAQRTYFGRTKRPARAGVIDWSQPVHEVTALVRALDFGGYRNPLLQAKVLVGDSAVAVHKARALDASSSAAPGTVLEVRGDAVVVRAQDGAVELKELATLAGQPLSPAAFAASFGIVVGTRLPLCSHEQAARLTQVAAAAAKHESHWFACLRDLEGCPVPWGTGGSAADTAAASSSDLDLPDCGGPDGAVAAMLAFLARCCGRERIDVAFAEDELARGVAGAEPVFDGHVPLCARIDLSAEFASARASVASALAQARQRGAFPRDLVARHPELSALRPHGWRAACPVTIALAAHQAPPADASAALTFTIGPDGKQLRLRWLAAVLSTERAARLRDQLAVFLTALARAPQRPLAQQPLMSDAERVRVLTTFNATQRAVAKGCVHDLFRAQAARTPGAIAVRARGKALTYAELDARSDRLAARLQALGVGPDALVGVYMQRSVELPVALLGILKAGGAYVPLDPDYPSDRIAFMAQDAGLRAAVVDAEHRAQFPGTTPSTPLVDVAESVTGSPATPSASQTSPSHLAYVIFTSGSTGKPKGVMVQHGNVVNFCAGMDERLGTQRGVWLAVTSLSFDISVLELLWTLTRGFEVVIYAGHAALTAAPATPPTAGAPTAAHCAAAPSDGRALSRAARPLAFSLFYFASDEGEGVTAKYHLLLEGARFADRHGFAAVWTPERHFHAFGGLYPNPSVASAAIAAVTERVKIRAGSVVSPLHHPIRIAEEWALVDNLSKGRVGISFAAGWQPDDFVLRPENFAARKQVMFDNIELVRRLWRGESVTFPGPKGPVAVRTLPRPVQRELDTWVTIAGNPETYVEAGKQGQRVLTHLLGQSFEELAEKLRLYRAAWQQAGHPGRPFVTLMLHTFVGDDDAAVKAAVRQPMKEYLRSAMDLVKRAAWSFPTFKDRTATGQSMDQIFAGGLTQEESEALLEHAFERYYETSGLFGTPASCAATVRRLKELEVDELACLIDFGVPSPEALAHLQHLLQLKQACDAETVAAQEVLAADDSTIPALIERHQVTHLQCTPSLAAMLLMEDRAKNALRRLDKMLVGGEALPSALARELTGLLRGELWNMYGPTETTVWSTCGLISRAAAHSGDFGIGTPLPNQRVYILDSHQQPVPLGAEGELWIAGDGVTRGYLGRAELTRERFTADPFAPPGSAARMYRTGDLAAWTERGELRFLGRADHQVKVRGYRIELGEIEAALRAQPSVRDAVVVARHDTPGDQRLVAYVVPTCHIAGCNQETLRDSLHAQLPEFMVPAHVVQLERFPLTPNRKIDRKALPAPDHSKARSTAFEAAGNELEATIAEVWRQALGVPRVGANDNFFDLGGHSLLAVKVHRDVQAAVGRQFSITALFQFPTVRALAASLQGDGKPSARVEESEVRGEARRASLLAQRQRVRPGRG
jgi:natural product biosynthesis luciferase-like monooxygenase protein